MRATCLATSKLRIGNSVSLPPSFTLVALPSYYDYLCGNLRAAVMPPHTFLAFCNSNCTFSSLTLALTLSLSLMIKKAMVLRHINASYARAQVQQCKCSRFRLTSFSFPMRFRNHSYYFAALMSRSCVQLPRRQKFPPRA